MSEDLKNNIRLSKAAKEFNIGMNTIIEFLGKKGHKIDSSPNTKLNGEMYALLVKEYQGEKEVKKNADQLGDFSYKGKSITVESTIKDENNDSEEEELTIRTNIVEDKPKAAASDKNIEKKKQTVEVKPETVEAPKAEAKEEVIVKQETPKEPVKVEAKAEVKEVAKTVETVKEETANIEHKK